MKNEFPGVRISYVLEVCSAIGWCQATNATFENIYEAEAFGRRFSHAKRIVRCAAWRRTIVRPTYY